MYFPLSFLLGFLMLFSFFVGFFDFCLSVFMRFFSFSIFTF